MKKYILDFSNIQNYSDIHRVIKEALDFPDYYGCSLDAFWDCLTDMYGEKMQITVIGAEVIEKSFGADIPKKIIEVLKRFKYFSDSFEKDIEIKIVNKSDIFIL